jgi:hypothetical protein
MFVLTMSKIGSTGCFFTQQCMEIWTDSFTTIPVLYYVHCKVVMMMDEFEANKVLKLIVARQLLLGMSPTRQLILENVLDLPLFP